jgi:hypothetical protein
MSIIENKLKKKQKPPEISIEKYHKIYDIQQFFHLKSNKLCFIKIFAKYHGIPVTGTKIILISRIELFFKKHISAIILQKNIRGYFVRYSFKLRGKAFSDKSFCVNESDFYTLEPLNEISLENFFSYTDEKNFTFGFDIRSLMQLFTKTGQFINPYNRDKLKLKVVLDIFALYGIIRSIFKDPSYLSYALPKIQFLKNDEFIENTFIQSNDVRVESFRTSISMTDIEIFLREIKLKPLLTRIQDAFVELDRLGNYTHSSWLTELSYDELYILYWSYNINWNRPGNIIPEVKRKIFPFGNPIESFSTLTLNREQILTSCLTIIENLIFSAIDIEDRKLGAMHVLSSLTVVSRQARTSYFYLYIPPNETDFF